MDWLLSNFEILVWFFSFFHAACTYLPAQQCLSISPGAEQIANSGRLEEPLE